MAAASAIFTLVISEISGESSARGKLIIPLLPNEESIEPLVL